MTDAVPPLFPAVLAQAETLLEVCRANQEQHHDVHADLRDLRATAGDQGSPELLARVLALYERFFDRQNRIDEQIEKALHLVGQAQTAAEAVPPPAEKGIFCELDAWYSEEALARVFARRYNTVRDRLREYRRDHEDLRGRTWLDLTRMGDDRPKGGVIYLYHALSVLPVIRSCPPLPVAQPAAGADEALPLAVPAPT